MKVQEALNSAILDLEHAEERSNCDYGNSISKCKSALAEIEKCEPVGWTNELQLSYLDDGDACLVYPDTTECPIPVFTSPPQREWVGLTDKRIEEIAKLNGAWQLYSSLKIFDFVANINDELKQLNTKG